MSTISPTPVITQNAFNALQWARVANYLANGKNARSTARHVDEMGWSTAHGPPIRWLWGMNSRNVSLIDTSVHTLYLHVISPNTRATNAMNEESFYSEKKQRKKFNSIWLRYAHKFCAESITFWSLLERQWWHFSSIKTIDDRLSS